MRMLTSRWGLLLAFGSLLGSACPGNVDDSTTTSESDGCELGSRDCGCLQGGLCDPGLLCASQRCVPSSDMSGSTSMTGSTTATTESSTDSSTSRGNGGCTPADDSINQKCANADQSKPYCNLSGDCVDCTGISACGPEEPACDALSGKCVRCLPDNATACVGQTPVCDGATQLCVPCAAHDECGIGACNFFTGECLAEESVIWVDSSDGACSDSGGTESEPFCSLSDAMVEVVEGKDGEAVVRIFGGPYTGGIVIKAAQKVAIIYPEAGSDYVSILGSGVPTISIEPGAVAILDGLSIADNDSDDGIYSNKALLWIDRTRVEGNAGKGLTSEFSSVVARSVILTANSAGGMSTTGTGSLQIENSFITENGSVLTPNGGIMASGGELDLVYTTMIGNKATLGTAASINCSGGTAATIRSSVLLGGGTSLSCDGALVKNSLIDFASEEASNLHMQSNEAMVFFSPSMDGVYRVLEMMEAVIVGEWSEGDPLADFEGDPRPVGPEFADYPGADVP